MMLSTVSPPTFEELKKQLEPVESSEADLLAHSVNDHSQKLQRQSDGNACSKDHF